MPVVRQVEEELLADPDHHHEYLPALGHQPACQAAIRLLLGADSPELKEGRAFSVQSLGGTGPLRVGAEFLRHQLGCQAARFSQPTWSNHRDIFLKAGYQDVAPYPYLDDITNTLNFPSLLSCLDSSQPKTVFIFHAQAHNPSGLDPSHDQWRQICSVVKRRQIIPFFDCAYQGWASGDLEEDAWVVRYFAREGVEMLVSQSFGKNLGLYGDRIGFLSFLVSEAGRVEAVKGQVTLVLRAMYGSPCRAPARIIEKVLGQEERLSQWRLELRDMVRRIQEVRQRLRSMLEEKVSSRDWSDITSQTGMFWYSGLSHHQGETLARHHVYITPSNGRVCLCGLNNNNIEYFASVIVQVMA